ncbi:MAG: deoxyribose-phosphate aldolase [Peptococcaceae bacterium]|nr:deoxyribose-phosphate aldolase [Peptococcaceae bacterium]
MDKMELAAMIDHTLLKPQATEGDIVALCREAKQYGFGAVCINPGFVKIAHMLLTGTNVKVCTVIGFPLGANTPEVKACEARDAMRNGAVELDMVLNIGALRQGNYELVKCDIEGVVKEAAQVPGTLVKVIIETCLLNEAEKIKACQLVVESGADFVKTSTGFASGGATSDDIRLMRRTVGATIGVKASGGIKSTSDALAMLEAGANRLGASAGIAILEGLRQS